MAAPSFETLLYSVEANVATITLNRPEKLNAFSDRMREDMIAAFDETDADDQVRAVIVTGAGRAFCAGADLAGGTATFDFEANKPDPVAARRPDGTRRDGGGLLTLRIFESLKPVICACNGPAAGVGASMQLAMDIRLASTDARYGFVFARRGIVPEAASSWFLPRLVGVQTALEWCCTGQMVPAAEAREKGLVRSVHAPGDLLPSARALAQEIVQNTAPVSIALTRQLIWRMMGASHPMEAHRADSRGMQARRASTDAREGVMSFREKRPANFPDRVSQDLPDIWAHWQAPGFD